MNKESSLSGSKILVFKTIVVLLPFACILLLEGCLHIFGYGHDPCLFVEDKGNSDFLVMNSHASERYFTNRDNATIGVFEPFRKKKTQGTFSITLVDSLKGDYEIRLLKEKWPFNQPKVFDVNNVKTFEERLAMTLLYQKITWIKAMETQLDYYVNNMDQKNTLKVAEASVLQLVNNADYLFYTGKLCTEQRIKAMPLNN